MGDSAAKIGILGPVELLAGGRILRPRARLQRALVAALALHINRMVPSRVLIDALWAEEPPPTVEVQMRRQVSRLRRDLGRELEVVTDPGGYRLRIDRERVDVGAFGRLVSGARRAREAGDLDRARDGMAAALSLWRGPALADLAGPYFEAEAAQLEERRLVAQEEYTDLRMASGEHRDLVGELAVQVSRYPARERPRAQLMLALHRAGRRTEALEVYRDGRDLLVSEFGLEPSPDLVRLHQAILMSDPGLRLETAGGPSRPGDRAADPRDVLIARLEEENSRLKFQVLEQGAVIGRLKTPRDVSGPAS